ncbi:MAG: hypothetical protein II247_04820 [Lachnospiraceae bacterium]|nr:hypothetical protein [Lachnospiraceae bacterium]
MLQVCMLAAAGLFAALVIKKDKPEFSTLIIAFVSVLIAIKVMGVIDDVLREIEDWQKLLGENAVYLSLFLKLTGITYICEFAANLTKDAGYSALSSNIELFGKMAIMVAGFPVIRIMIDMLEGMMG